MGRADTMGLAISLVSAVPEKVGLLGEEGQLPPAAALPPNVALGSPATSTAAGVSGRSAFPPPTRTRLFLFLPLRRPRQVWFCTAKGLKPWLQPDAQNTRTNEQGGHTTWYDEPGLLKVRLRRGQGGICVCSSAARGGWHAGAGTLEGHRAARQGAWQASGSVPTCCLPS